MSNPRDLLTEEVPESPQDFKKRELTEVGGEIRHDPSQRVLTEDLPEDEEKGPQTLTG
jgi:hypothetical protein